MQQTFWKQEESFSDICTGWGYGKSELTVEKKRRALSEGAERRELLTDYSAFEWMQVKEQD